MAKIKTKQVEAVVARAAQVLIDAGGVNQVTSVTEMKEVSKALAGNEKQLLNAFYRFVQNHHGKSPRQGVSATEVSAAAAFAKSNLISAFDADRNGLSAEEVARMGRLGKLAVSVSEDVRKGRATAILAARFNEAMQGAAYTSGHTYAPRFVAGSIPPGRIDIDDIREALRGPVMSFLNQGRMSEAPLSTNDVVWEEYSPQRGQAFIEGLRNSADAAFRPVLELAAQELGPLRVVRAGPQGPDGQPSDSAGLYTYAIVGRAKETGLLAGIMFGSVEA